jgi:hypothetical protein
MKESCLVGLAALRVQIAKCDKGQPKQSLTSRTVLNTGRYYSCHLVAFFYTPPARDHAQNAKTSQQHRPGFGFGDGIGVEGKRNTRNIIVIAAIIVVIVVIEPTKTKYVFTRIDDGLNRFIETRIKKMGLIYLTYNTLSAYKFNPL